MSNGMVRVAPVTTAVASYEPQNYSELTTLAAQVAASRVFGVNSKEEAAVIMLTGASLGISPIAALRGIHVIKGKASLSADLMAAVIQRSPECEFWEVVEATEKKCTIRTKRRSHSEPKTVTWTLEDAQRAKLTGDANGNWAKFPRAMLRARCTAELGRMVYSDLLFGVYVEGEVPGDREPTFERDVPPVRATVVQEEPSHDEATADRVAELERFFDKARTKAEVDAIVAEVAALGLAKGSPERVRLMQAWQRAVERVTRRPDPPDGPGDRAAREPGSDDDATGDAAEAGDAAGNVALARWRAHLPELRAQRHAVNSWGKHSSEFGDDRAEALDLLAAHMVARGWATGRMDALALLGESTARKAA